MSRCPHARLVPAFIAILVAVAASIVMHGWAHAQDSKVTVSPSALNGWELAIPTPGTTVAFVTGPGKPPLGAGSVYVTTNSAGTSMLGTRVYAGTRLNQITRLSYYTYRNHDDPDNRPIVTLQFDIDFDSTDSNTQPQGRLVYAPKRTGTPDPMDTWQKWDALAWDALWYVTIAPTDHDDCTMREPCTWYSLLKHFPNAAVHPTGGQLLFYASNPGLSSVPAHADALTVGISQQNTTYDFEPAPSCKETCYVDGINGNDTFSGNSPARALRTIQAAVDRVQSGGTVIVASAVYSESVLIARPLTLRGPNADVCANDAKDPTLPASQRAAEATLAPTGLPAVILAPGVDNVTIAGFHFGASAAAGIVAHDAPSPGFETIRITNNLFDQVAGPAISSERAARTSWTIACNRVLAGTGVQPALVSLVAGETRSLTANANYFGGSSDESATALLLDNPVDTTVTNSAFDAFGGAAIRIRDGATNLLVEGNTLSDSALGVHLLATGSMPLASVSVQHNHFTDLGQAAVRLQTPAGESSGMVSELLICNNRMMQDVTRMANGAALVDLHVSPLAAQAQGLMTVRDNTFELRGAVPGAIHAIHAAGAIGELVINGNVLGGGNMGGVGDTSQPASSAIYLQSHDPIDGAIPYSAVITITANRIGGFENGIAVFDPVAGVDGGLADGTQVTVKGNEIAGNAQFGALTGAGAPLQAAANWWGDASGPGGAGPGTGDRISANVSYCPWLNAPLPDGQAVAPVQNIDTGSYFCAINAAVNAAETLDGHTVRAAPGRYVEQVTISKSVTVTGSGAGQSILQAPATLPSATSADSAIVSVGGAGVAAELTGFTIAGPGPAGVCGSIRAGIFVHDGASASIHGNAIIDIRDEPMTACQQGIAIVVGSAALQTSGTATIYDNVLTGYQKGGIAVSGGGSAATIRGNEVVGAGPTTLLVQNGIQVASGATATITGNRVTGHSFTPFSLVSTGILLFKADADTAGNTLEENQVGLYLVDSSGSHDANTVRATADGTRSPIYWGIIVDAPPPDRIPQPGDLARVRAADVRLAAVSDARGVQTVTVTNSELESDNSAGGVGIQADGGYGVLDIDLTATNNYVRNWQRGVYVVQCDGASCSGAGYSAAIFRHNSITGNDSGFNNGNAVGLGVNARENWWGAETGPAASNNPGGAGDALLGDAAYSPWLCTGADTDPGPGFQPDTGNLCGLPAQLIFDQQPTGAIENIPLSPQPIVRAVDAQGNPAPSFVGPVTLAVAPAGAAGLAGQTTVIPAGGVAIFSDVAFTDIAGSVTVQATSPGLPLLTGDPFAITPQTAQLTVRVVVAGQTPATSWSVAGAWGTAEIDAEGGEAYFAEVRANRAQTVAVAAKNGYTALVECDDGNRGDASVTLNLPYQSSTLCTFTMTAQPATVSVRKVVSGLAPASAWRFAGDLGDFEVPASGGEVRFAPAAGVVQIAEEPKPGYDTTVTCSNGAAGAQSAFLALAPAENVSCTFAAIEQPSGVSLQKTVGLVPGECAPSSVIAVPAGTTVYYCYTVTNSGDAPLAVHALTDSKFGVVFPALAHELAPGETLSTATLGYVISETVQATTETSGRWTATAPEGAQAQDSAATAVNVLRPAIEASLTLLDEKGRCTTTPVTNVAAGRALTFCLTIRNAGEVALNRHLVSIDELNYAATLDRVIEPGVTEHFLASEIAGLATITATATTTYTASITSTNAPTAPNRRNIVYPAPELFVAVDRTALTVWVVPIAGAGRENWIFLPAVVR